jgi:peptide-methionine (S)-S-oxide reductase
MGNLSEEELIASALATKLNAYAADLCAPHIQMRIDSKISDILRNGWPILQEI